MRVEMNSWIDGSVMLSGRERSGGSTSWKYWAWSLSIVDEVEVDVDVDVTKACDGYRYT